MQLDPLDVKILRLLRDDARLSFRDIAEKTGSTVPTVSARVKALEDIGLIQGYHAKIDLALTGGPLVHVGIQTEPRAAEGIAEAVARMPGAEDVVLLAGAHVHARIRLRAHERTLQTLHQAIAALEGVTTYDVREVLAIATPPQQEDLPEQFDVACHQCRGPIHAAPVRKTFHERTHVFCCRQCLAAFAERSEKIAAKAAAGKPKPAAKHRHT